MKRMFNIIMMLLIIYLLVQFIFSFFIRSHLIIYEIEVDNKIYNITENFNNKYKTENIDKFDNQNYYYEIRDDEQLLFSFKLIGNFIGNKKFLKDLILYKQENLICVYPVFAKHENQLDVICNNGDIQFTYLSLKGQNQSLDKFVESLQQLGFNHYSWQSSEVQTIMHDNVELYIENILDNQYIVLWHYNGIYIFTANKEKKLELLKQDRYNNDLGVMVNQYYLIPDDNQQNTFQRLISTNVVKLVSESIELHYDISFNSFVQGVVDDKIYLIDKIDNRQYEVNINNKKASLIGDAGNMVKHYRDGKWEERNIYDVIDNELIFGYEQKIPEVLADYERTNIDEVMGDTDGYYYLYLGEGDNTAVYRVDKQNLDIKTKLFKLPTITSVKYIEDAIYFISNDHLYMYSDSLGLRPLLKYNELKFNQNNMYNIYIH